MSKQSPLRSNMPGIVHPKKEFARYAKRHARRYGLDWKLVVAVMNRESSFRHTVTSRKGAYGLMQIMPRTRDDIRKKLGLTEAKSPSNNVKAATYYLVKLSKRFRGADEVNQLKLTLASYNAGLTRVRDAQAVAAYLGEDPNSWDAVRSTLPLLSRRYESFHAQVWSSGKPKSGYFGNAKETIAYVEGVIESYEEYRVSYPLDDVM